MNSSFSSEQYGPWALIAGGSEGIGYCFAQKLAASGINLILLARRTEALDEAKASLEKDFSVEVRTHSVDLTASNLPGRIDEITSGLDIGLLIYNAGAMHGANLFLDDPLEKAQKLVGLNCNGPVVLCHKLGQAMRERGRGGIILLSSMSGLAGGAYVASYAATKSFDIVFAEALWAEMKPFGVNVLGLIAGVTDTPAMERSGIQFEQDGESVAMNAEDVAREGLENLAEGPLHIAGENNRGVGDLLRGSDRRQAVELMTFGAASMYDKPFPINSEVANG